MGVASISASFPPGLKITCHGQPVKVGSLDFSGAALKLFQRPTRMMTATATSTGLPGQRDRQPCGIGNLLPWTIGGQHVGLA